MSGDTERARLVRQLDADGHTGCAADLADADDSEVVDLAYEIAEHVEEACGCPDRQHPELADSLRAWADAYEHLT